MKTEIKLDVELDENRVPNNIQWSASDTNDGGPCEAFLLAIWDKKENSTLRIDLWGKEFSVDDMKIMMHQTLMTMADTFERATSESEMASEMREFGTYFKDRMGI